MVEQVTDADIIIVGGGSAGCTAAIEAQRLLPRGRVVVVEKAHVKRSGAIAIGMDGLNNAIVPGHATPEQYVKEITMANDGIVNQRAVMAYAVNSFAMIEQLDAWGVKFQKTETGDFDVKKVHHKGRYVLPMPEGHDLKKILTRVMKRAGVQVINRIAASRVLLDRNDRGRVAGVVGLDVRTGEVCVVRGKAVILCCGASGRLGLPASGYLYGTYENPSNAGDGYSMAYHAGAELTGIECFQVNPLIKDYNGPACAYVTGPLGGHTVNALGHRFIESDYWSGQMMLEFHRELHSARGPVYLKLTHLAPETLAEIERVLHGTERPSRGRFHAGRGRSYASDEVEMHVSEIGLCSGHSASGVWVSERGETTVPGLYAAGDMASVPHNYLLGALTCGKICAENAREYVGAVDSPGPDGGDIEDERQRLLAPLGRPRGIPHHQYEYKVRRLVNDYLQPPKTANRMNIGLEHFLRAREELGEVGATNPHELMRVLECGFIRDCAEMAARASLYRTESRWGLYHHRLDYPEMSDDWFVHVNLKKDARGEMTVHKREVAEYVVAMSRAELAGYHGIRVKEPAAGAGAAP
ncbi:MAG TPA: fumarate reductase/succinate dehydrogenase flavoprotein subunit [Polyangiaceae bacterium]|jgi:succinate dehydrogenase/fumarate reductase flavoprotein subunit|nr:fumarate reductase/succinate dehydrogenase flavoprotein subunit [Polyangiaceae bacterium]